MMGNALEAADVIGVLDGCDACVSTLGGEADGVRVDYKGNMNAIENAGILGVTRMVLVTSVGAGDSKVCACALSVCLCVYLAVTLFFS